MSRWLGSFIKVILVGALSIGIVLESGPADAAPQGTTRLTYQVYAGGMHVLQAELDLTVQKKSYMTQLSALTKGILGTLAPWHGTFFSKGTRDSNGIFHVQEHKSVSTWKGSDDVAIYQYNQAGNLTHLSLTEEGQDRTPKDLDRSLTQATTDILTATLNMMHHIDRSGTCEGQSSIFDSRRRFTLLYRDLGQENLPKGNYSLYSGPASKCTAEVVPDGGAWHKKPRGWLSIQEQGRKQGTLPTLWLARIHDRLPPVPVRIMIKTDYGTLFMHLSQAVNETGQALSVP